VIEITAIRLADGTTHEHIVAVQWQTASSTGQTSRQGLIDWLNASPENRAIVAGEGEDVPVLVVEPPDGTLQVRTFAHGRWTDHLLALPRF
jgi:catechol-2,3-dioxygenase